LQDFFNFTTLEQKIRYTLGKTERLKSSKAIDELFAKGKSFSIFPLKVMYLTSSNAAPAFFLQAGFTASSKKFKKAVERNRIKRLMREAYRLQKNELQLLTQSKQLPLQIFFVYTGNELPMYNLIVEKMSSALSRLIKIIDEKSIIHT
jgi:ribonuclease P protein component